MLAILKFIPYGLPKVLTFSGYTWAKEKSLHLHIKTFILGALEVSVLEKKSCDGSIKFVNP